METNTTASCIACHWKKPTKKSDSFAIIPEKNGSLQMVESKYVPSVKLVSSVRWAKLRLYLRFFMKIGSQIKQNIPVEKRAYVI